MVFNEIIQPNPSSQRLSYEQLLKYLSLFPPTSESSTTKQVASRAVIEAIRIPEVLDFEDLVALYAVQSLRKEDAAISQLLDIFLNGSLTQYQEFCKSNPGFMESHGA